MNSILVLGGTGFVGRALCQRLAALSPRLRIVVPSRHAARAKGLSALPTVQLVQAYVHDDATLASLVAGCDAVVNLVAILHGSAAAFDRTHVQLPRNLAQACRNAGVHRLVHVSALGVGREVNAAPSNYLRSKTAGEHVLEQSGLQLTLLRPSVIFGAEDSFLNLFAQLQRLAPFLPLAGTQARFQPVWVDDVAAAIVAALQQPASIGKTYELAGPTVYTLAELVRLAGRWSGHERPIMALPDGIARLQALAMELMPGPTLMSRDNIDSMKLPNVASGQLPGLQALGITPTPLEAIGPGYLGHEHGRAKLEKLRAGARRD
jgi:uncharacterized protein YbjT (DUF2867 family)